MNLIITALLFNFLKGCWPKTNIVNSPFVEFDIEIPYSNG